MSDGGRPHITPGNDEQGSAPAECGLHLGDRVSHHDALDHSVCTCQSGLETAVHHHSHPWTDNVRVADVDGRESQVQLKLQPH